MNRFSNSEYLRTQQYNDSGNLDARVRLHARFSVNKYPWQRWVFDQMKLSASMRVLELGCGPAYLWAANIDRLPARLELTLTDFSAGMLQEARARLDAATGIEYRIIDIQTIPYVAESFDVVIANHMLYHVPHIHNALSEVHRVLKPGGVFFASTVGRGHMRELTELVRRVEPSIAYMGNSHTEVFNLETGGEQLAEFFDKVSMHHYDDALVVTETEPLIAYIMSMTVGPDLTTAQRDSAAQVVEREFQRNKAIHITKESGLFICIKK